jgi:hypothetical protein
MNMLDGIEREVEIDDQGLIGSATEGMRTDSGNSELPLNINGASTDQEMGLLPPPVTEGLFSAPVSGAMSVDASGTAMQGISAMVDPFANPQGEPAQNGNEEDEEVDAFQGALDEFYYDANSVVVDPFHWFAGAGSEFVGPAAPGAGGPGAQGQGQGLWAI